MTPSELQRVLQMEFPSLTDEHFYDDGEFLFVVLNEDRYRVRQWLKWYCQTFSRWEGTEYIGKYPTYTRGPEVDGWKYTDHWCFQVPITDDWR